MTTQTDLQTLRDEVRALAERLSALEAQPTTSTTAVDGAAAPDAFWALTGLRSRLGDAESTRDGAVMLVGAVTLPTGAPVEWQQSAGTRGMFEVEWEDHAAAFAALGHPVRLELLRQILSGTHATAELAGIESLGTTGQLHHHLRQLVTTGWVKQTGRGSYDVPASRVVPLLACLTAVAR
ncbi:ArsR/SmtB family transcription factor [Mycetocola zhadangensis]|uniref:ArsR family transcriptional regulator n=1 Tax=Mycetocola zhadangensis TaxID=1164595 RepID=A0A3L7IWV9_9MICO|nr:winged helix-turn-helix domain-containing protein [Mycetocola zhadangensis]RLQ82569.1 ArsR family transcriptional regulator [Mycetocola zhadangensis]GGF00214.1 transcriptional regulator [Mycetocola zhadangensis]